MWSIEKNIKNLNLVSAVFCLYAKPSSASFLFETVLKSARTMRAQKRRFWYSLSSTTPSQ